MLNKSRPKRHWKEEKRDLKTRTEGQEDEGKEKKKLVFRKVLAMAGPKVFTFML